MSDSTSLSSAELTRHIRFALLHLYEIDVLDRGPARVLGGWLAQFGPTPADMPAGQRLHDLLLRAIERIKPAGMLDPKLPRHRHYLILKRRYIDRVPLPQLEAEFSSSNRQFRRDNHRAVEELVATLGEMLPPASQSSTSSEVGSDKTIDEAPNELTPFSRSIEAVDVWSVFTDASKTLAAVTNSAGITIRVNVQPDLPPANADRAALRLACVKALWLAITHCSGSALNLDITANEADVILALSALSSVASHDAVWNETARLTALAGGELRLLPAGNDTQQITICLPRHRQPVVLVIDDDPAMLRIIERYLGLQPVQIRGCRSSEDVIGTVKKTKPTVVLLDILMPHRDGWEVLQELKADTETYHVNVVVCSIWDERELALTLGADAFFQKPIDRTALLEYLGPFMDAPPAPAERTSSSEARSV
ncbi:MAG: response regulator [Anaerolineae bacterium]|nr:response regulator [Thermoflexales bacterium]MDW8406437.1 response regulator [Anaerolineae bacterium]